MNSLFYDSIEIQAEDNAESTLNTIAVGSCISTAGREEGLLTLYTADNAVDNYVVVDEVKSFKSIGIVGDTLIVLGLCHDDSYTLFYYTLTLRLIKSIPFVTLLRKSPKVKRTVEAHLRRDSNIKLGKLVADKTFAYITGTIDSCVFVIRLYRYKVLLVKFFNKTPVGFNPITSVIYKNNISIIGNTPAGGGVIDYKLARNTRKYFYNHIDILKVTFTDATRVGNKLIIIGSVHVKSVDKSSLSPHAYTDIGIIITHELLSIKWSAQYTKSEVSSSFTAVNYSDRYLTLAGKTVSTDYSGTFIGVVSVGGINCLKIHEYMDYISSIHYNPQTRKCVAAGWKIDKQSRENPALVSYPVDSFFSSYPEYGLQLYDISLPLIREEYGRKASQMIG